jgi:hypothetical protein
VNCKITGNGHIYSPNGINKNKTLDMRVHRDIPSSASMNSAQRKRSKYKMLDPDLKRKAVIMVS